MSKFEQFNTNLVIVCPIRILLYRKKLEILDYYFKVQLINIEDLIINNMQINFFDAYSNQQCASIMEIGENYNIQNYLKQSCFNASCFQENHPTQIKTIQFKHVVPFLKKIIRNGEFRDQMFKIIQRNSLNKENNSIYYQRLQNFQNQYQAYILQDQTHYINIPNFRGSKNQFIKNQVSETNEMKHFLNNSTFGLEQTESFLQLRQKVLTLTPKLTKELFPVQEVDLINLSVCLFTKFFFHNKEEIGRFDLGWAFAISYLIAVFLTQRQDKDEISSKFSEFLKIKKQNVMEFSMTFLKKIEFQVSIEMELSDFVQAKLQKHYKEY